MCKLVRGSRRRYAAVGLTIFRGTSYPAGIRPSARTTHVFRLLFACLAALPSQVHAQEAPDRQGAPDRFLLEAGLVGGNSTCSGRYVGINGRVAGPVSLYGMVETYRCTDWAGSANRIGASVLLGRSSWLVRPALRAGIEHRGGDDVWPTAGVSLTLGRRYGARSIFHVGDESGGTGLRFQMGGYVSF